MLPPDLARLWDQYLDAEREGVRETWQAALARFVGAVRELPEDVWQNWALEIVREVADHGESTPIRFPLFRHVLLPALVPGIVRGRGGCARWLAHFESLLFHCCGDAAALPENLRSRVGLLREALRVDPDDDLARARLVASRGSYLGYTLHELPSGVLYGHNGATAEQCDELLELLREFEGHVERLGVQERWRELIMECRFHFVRYRDYLRSDRVGGSYSIYLASRGEAS